ncbi:unnamed protein product [Staurois parvus]|uniref:Uncharacterized protein n=1 Tax=Staurois parvus TaxID=386267 RepID=A0ABN9FYI8_9NEOB|nr:unnamed protein product [Staurois parvus]
MKEGVFSSSILPSLQTILLNR